jgi:uroporphyrinogen decarboxylase
MMDLVMRPAWLRELLEKCTEVAIAFAIAQIDAGAHVIGLGDAVASQVSPRMYRQFALPYEQRIFAVIKAKGAIPRLHICGNITHLLPDIGRTGADIVDLDWMVNLHEAAVTVNGLALCGNLDPVAVFLQGTPETVYAGILENAAVCYPRWISAAGCEIPEQTPAENLLAQAQTLRDLAGRSQL